MLIPLALLSLSGTVATPASAYPLESVLSAARTLCASAPDVEKAERGPLPAGWRLANPEAGSWQEDYRRGMERVVTGFTAKARVLGAVVQGRPLWAFVSTSKGPPLQPEASSCEVVDREAVIEPDDERVARWAGQPPRLGRRDVLPGLFGWSWDHGLDPANSKAELTYVNAAAAAKAHLRPGLSYLTVTIPRHPAP